MSLQCIDPAKTLRQHRAVGLDGVALALLQAIGRVVAVEKRLLDVAVGVEDQGRDLLEAVARVELLAKPKTNVAPALKGEMSNLTIWIPARPLHVQPGRAEKALGPELSDSRAHDRIVVRKVDCTSTSRHVPVARQRPEQLRELD